MSQTLGEKLRQAREERGFTLSEVAEQTRISTLYLECIENNDYKLLPGGIFNKGFVKSFAKFVGLNEQEALADYAALAAASESEKQDHTKSYRPEVLTDDRSSGSMLPTVIVAAIILGLMTLGILYGLRYLRGEPDANVASTPKSNTNGTIQANTESRQDSPVPEVPTMADLKVEFKAVTAAVSLSSTVDGKSASELINAGASATFEPKERLKLSYSRSLASAVEMAINGKPIVLPSAPLIPRRNTIEFEISKDNLAEIWNSGSIGGAAPVPADTNSNSNSVAATPLPAGTATPRTTPAQRPNVTPVPAATPGSTPRPANTDRPRVVNQ